MNNKEKIRKVFFANVGRKNQHEVKLFGFGMLPFNLENARNMPGLALTLIDDYYKKTIQYLKIKGFNDPYGFFHIIDKKIKKCDEDTVPRYSLWAAIEIRDNEKGQKGEYLAALIIHHHHLLMTAWGDLHNNGNIKVWNIILDQALIIQHLFHDLFLLEIHPKFSAGESRTGPATREKILQSSEWINKAEPIYRQKIKNGNSKRRSAKLTEEALKRDHPSEDVPDSETIRGWFK